MATRRELILRISSAIEPLYGAIEARQIAEMVVVECGGVGRNITTYYTHNILVVVELYLYTKFSILLT